MIKGDVIGGARPVRPAPINQWRATVREVRGPSSAARRSAR